VCVNRGNDRIAGSYTQREPFAHAIAAGDLEAVFLPGRGMIVASLRHRGTELLRRIDDLEAMAEKGNAAGIPLLHPWANRLAANGYRAAGREVVLDPKSPLLHLDEQGLLIHGVPWAFLAWEVIEARQDGLVARLEWERDDLLAIFPFRHRLEMAATLRPEGLTLETTLVASHDAAVPVSFGFHPYFGIPALPRQQWRMALPAMRKLLLDERGIPTGTEESFGGFDAPLGELDFDSGFSLLEGTSTPSLCLLGGGRRIAVEFLEGYRYAQVFAPKGKEFVALEPMTAPTNALITHDSLRLVKPGEQFRAVFRVRVDTLP
jgi:aldose 1-epimerase